MKGWHKRKLNEVCELINGRAYSKPELLSDGKYPVLRVGNFFTNNHWYYSDLELEERKYCDTGDLLYAWSASFGPRIWTGGKVIFHYHIWKVAPDPLLIDKKFLFHFLSWDTEKIKIDQGAGTTMIHVSKSSMDERDILLPPLPEQHRIVAILDTAFDHIATARANCEANLLNARAIFESHLQAVFTQRGDGWVVKSFDEVLVIKNGKDQKPVEKKGGKYPIYGSAGNVMGWTDAFICDEQTTIIGRKGTINKPLFIETKFWNVDTAFGLTAKPNLNAKFLYFFCLSYDFSAHNRGTTIPSLVKTDLLNIKISIPSINAQEALLVKFSALHKETQRLESLYQRKLQALDDLKKSLLHQAFSGLL